MPLLNWGAHETEQSVKNTMQGAAWVINRKTNSLSLLSSFVYQGFRTVQTNAYEHLKLLLFLFKGHLVT